MFLERQIYAIKTSSVPYAKPQSLLDQKHRSSQKTSIMSRKTALSSLRVVLDRSRPIIMTRVIGVFVTPRHLQSYQGNQSKQLDIICHALMPMVPNRVPSNRRISKFLIKNSFWYDSTGRETIHNRSYRRSMFLICYITVISTGYKLLFW